MVESWDETLEGSTSLIIKNIQDMNALGEINPKWRESLDTSNITSMVLVPLMFGYDTLGYIWATNFDVNNAVRIKEVLELSAFFLGSEIANYNLVNRLKVLSSTDLLTNVLNRNAMNNRVSDFENTIDSSLKSMGVIFADLNGLKKINDIDGHIAGDNYLKEAARVLMDVFVEEEIYRAGGDEFVILAINEPKDKFEDKIKELRAISDGEGRVSFALGSVWSDSDFNIKKSMHEADELMYEDKEEYYRKYPDRRYRQKTVK